MKFNFSKKQVSAISFLMAILVSCKTNPLKLTIIQRQVLEGVPSASGLSKTKGEFFVIGDNSTWVFRLNSQFRVKDKLPLIPGTKDSILPKAMKPDWEAVATIQTENGEELLIFGSGSKLPYRNALVRLKPGKGTVQSQQYSLESFYGALKSSEAFKGGKLNIEGAAASGNRLYLFNRNNNLLIQIPLDGFLRYIAENGPLPEVKIFAIQLPVLNGLQATFSGATFIPGTSHIIFTASVENNQDPVADGEIAGSFVGVIHEGSIQENYQPKCILLAENNQPVKIKVESVETLNSVQGQAEILLVTDSDGGPSEIIRASIIWD